ncbi:hypothetical protein EXM22_10600 [Oceanispirochaeta crateris]|uniref:Haemolysin activator HlyB C-terminal domain-containing protein n=1 Tax=Oceanispirochaeta crateris TaxID=2518645 RepID=A0A5C1QLB1_9SPIO|nr:ShlB/FhaC/HecB family hemolysin secretion/activation protein [Oceanispirochaeta crateris]QEN08411.1 hypothetical protein EXM22_10600 [Oceanispirochaeta crateris]
MRESPRNHGENKSVLYFMSLAKYYLWMEKSLAKLVILPFLIFNSALLYAQEMKGDYFLNEIQYDIDGRTRESALENYLDLPEELNFTDFASMDDFADRVVQDLLNLRVFEKVESELIPLENDALSPNDNKSYKMRVVIKDGWTLFPLIVPTFDTNDNLSLKWKINYANVLGSLVEFDIDGDFGIDQHFDDYAVDINYWNIESNFSNIYYRGINYTFSWNQAYARIIEKDGTEYTNHYSFYKTDFFLTGTFDLGNGYFYELGPALEFTYNYQDRLESGTSTFIKEPQSFGIYQKGGQDRVDWMGNFQSGNHYEGEIKTRIVPTQGFKGALYLTNRWFTIFNSRLSYGNRITAFSTYNDELFSLGEYMRGVPDFNLSGDWGFFVNNTLPISLLKWKGVMETQIQPFIDFGLVHPSSKELSPSRDMRLSLGGDLVFFPENISSVNLRLTLGYDLFGPGTPSDRYEILLSTSLFF